MLLASETLRRRYVNDRRQCFRLNSFFHFSYRHSIEYCLFVLSLSQSWLGVASAASSGQMRMTGLDGGTHHIRPGPINPPSTPIRRRRVLVVHAPHCRKSEKEAHSPLITDQVQVQVLAKHVGLGYPGEDVWLCSPAFFSKCYVGELPVASNFSTDTTRGMIMTFGTILAYYTEFLLPTTPKYQLTLVGTIPPFLLLALALIWGRLLDAGHHRKLNIIAGVCLVGGLTGLAFTAGNDEMGDGKYWAILLAAIPMGVGQSIYFLAAPHMAKTWFPNNKGFAMGITNSGAALGGVAWPFVFTSLAGAVDFRLGVGALAAISLAMSIFIAWAAMPAPSFSPRSMGTVRKFSTWVPTRAFRSRTFLVHIAAMCCIYLGILTIPFLIEVWAQKKHLGIPESVDFYGHPVHFDGDKDLTVYIVVAMNACQLPGRLLGSTICDYVQARKIHAVACIAALIEVALAWNLATNYAGACTFASFFGLILGIMVSLPINDVQEILGKDRTHLLGQYAGMVYTCASPFILTGGIVSGALVDHHHIRAPGIWACVTFGLGFVLIFISLVIKDDTWKFDQDTLPQTRERVQVKVEKGESVKVGS